MRFVAGQDNNQAIRSFLSTEDNLKCAVAFWGVEAYDLLTNGKEEVRIICNLDSGATNPSVISRLACVPGTTIRNQSKLHAKVYLGLKTAIVGSSNVSANGLGLEGETLKGWTEASMILTDMRVLEAIEAWFEDQWKAADEIDEELMSVAREKWRQRTASASALVANLRDSISEGQTMAETFKKLIIETLDSEPLTVRQLYTVAEERLPDLRRRTETKRWQHNLRAALEVLQRSGVVVHTDDAKGSPWQLKG